MDATDVVPRKAAASTGATRVDYTTMESASLNRYLNGTREFLQYLANVRNAKVRRLLELIRDNPGCNIDELAQGLAVRRTAALHHMRRLEQDVVVVKVRQGRHRLHFLAAVSPIQRTAFCLLRVPSVRAFIEYVYRTPHYSPEAMASELNVSARTVRRAIRKLENKGLLTLEANPNSPHPTVHLHPEVRIVLARYQGRSPLPRDDARDALMIAHSLVMPAALALARTIDRFQGGN